jgi:hypothetical protein
VGAPDCVRAVQVKLSRAREYLNRDEDAKALQEVNEALDIDPDFLAAQLLRESIIIGFADRGQSLSCAPLVTIPPAGSDGAADQDELHSVHDLPVEEDLGRSIPTGTIAAEPFAAQADLMYRGAPELAASSMTPAPAQAGWRPWPGAVVMGLLAVSAAMVGAVGEAKLGWIGRPLVIVVPAPSLPRVQAPPAPRFPSATGGEALAVGDTPLASPIATPTATAAADDRLVRLAVERYQLAMNAHARAHPIESLETWVIDRCVVSVDGDAATARCRGTITTEPGRDTSRVSTFTLRRTAGIWRIVAVESEGS